MIAFSCTQPDFPAFLPPSSSSLGHLSTLISQFSFGVSEICDFEFWLEIKLSLAISIKSEAAAAVAVAGDLCKQAYVCISDESAAPAPGLSSMSSPLHPSPPGRNECMQQPTTIEWIEQPMAHFVHRFIWFVLINFAVEFSIYAALHQSVRAYRLENETHEKCVWIWDRFLQRITL